MSTPVKQLLDQKGHDVIGIGTSESVFEALGKMVTNHIGCLLVYNKQNELSGIVSERDCIQKVILQDKDPREVQVRRVMTPKNKLICVNPDEDLDSCMALMTENRVRHLPVSKSDRVVGILSIGDVVKHLCSEKELMINNLEHYITGSL